jgi:hypothetical protein
VHLSLHICVLLLHSSGCNSIQCSAIIATGVCGPAGQAHGTQPPHAHMLLAASGTVQCLHKLRYFLLLAVLI